MSLDIHELAKDPNLTLNISSKASEDSSDAKVRRFKECTLFIVTVCLIVCAFVFCGYIVLNPHSNINDQKWAMTLDGAIISALIGYIVK